MIFPKRCLVYALIFLSFSSQANTSLMGFEFLGRSLYYNIFYEYEFTKRNFSLGAGLTYLGMSNSEDAILFGPVYMNLYLSEKKHRGYFTGGYLISDPKDVWESRREENKSIGIPTGGIGWESKSESGFTFRIAAYAFLLLGPIPLALPWAGISLGNSF